MRRSPSTLAGPLAPTAAERCALCDCAPGKRARRCPSCAAVLHEPCWRYAGGCPACGAPTSPTATLAAGRIWEASRAAQTVAAGAAFSVGLPLGALCFGFFGYRAAVVAQFALMECTFPAGPELRWVEPAVGLLCTVLCAAFALWATALAATAVARRALERSIERSPLRLAPGARTRPEPCPLLFPSSLLQTTLYLMTGLLGPMALSGPLTASSCVTALFLGSCAAVPLLLASRGFTGRWPFHPEADGTEALRERLAAVANGAGEARGPSTPLRSLTRTAFPRTPSKLAPSTP